MNTVNAGLCGGRHPMPQVTTYVFPTQVEDPLDFSDHQWVTINPASLRKNVCVYHDETVGFATPLSFSAPTG